METGDETRGEIVEDKVTYIYIHTWGKIRAHMILVRWYRLHVPVAACAGRVWGLASNFCPPLELGFYVIERTEGEYDCRRICSTEAHKEMKK